MGAPRRAGVAWLVLAALMLWPALAGAQQKGEPGRFDHYVLALSWSPSYCEAMGERAEPAQCATARPFAFVVHGLWPQYKRGWPENCVTPAPYVPEPVLRSMLDIMPSRRLVLHEWRTHGTCATPDPAAYFDLVRRAYAGVTIPAAFRRLDDYRMVSPAEVESAFRADNPGLAADMIAVGCDGRRLTEVRICLDRSLGFTPCPEVDRRACRAARVVMPPVREGASAR
ncbi:ribonuclease T2 [Ancylobacter sp. TS-1]|uniref:ribonuclease T2 family protein n=1 Tax=Ancylobacter sp. TS-1 TaxID=1850374 RepID=UPI001265BB7B|nr:ribonuclease T2 [Ancylobacter sp. TS-1]QFR32887.1 ribonuclease T [Ancylobacter sp. TS-1]